MRRWILSLLMLAASVASAQTFRRTDAGLYGAPYGTLGPNGRPFWEQYRKDYFKLELGPLYGSTTVVESQLDARDVTYVRIHHGQAPGLPGVPHASHVPGLFIGRARARRSPKEARWSLKRFGEDGGVGRVELRIGFVQDGDTPTFGSIAAMLASFGGDTGWGTDIAYGGAATNGLYLQTIVDNRDATWRLDSPRAHLLDPTLSEPSRLDFGAQVEVSATPSDAGSGWVLPTPSDQPLALETELEVDGGVATLVVWLGETRLAWRFDDGLTRHGLTSTGLFSEFVDGGLDLGALVPVLYLGGGDWHSMGDRVPEGTMELRVSGATPTAERSVVRSAWPAGATVEIRAVLPGGDLDEHALMAVNVAASPLVVMPSAFTFNDAGRTTVSLRADAPGSYDIELFEQGAPDNRTRFTFETLCPMCADAGDDAGSQADAGPQADAGAEADAGSDADAGRPLDAGTEVDSGVTEPPTPTQRLVTVGCACGALEGMPLWLLLVVLRGARRVKAGKGEASER